MAQASTILSADRGRASAVALGVLGLLASAQVALVVAALLKHSAAPVAKPALPAPATVLAPPVSFSPPPVGSLAAPARPASPLGPPPVGSLQAPVAPPTATPPPVPGQAAPLAASPARSAPPVPRPAPPGTASVSPAEAAANLSLEQSLELAKQVRSLGDMQGALEVLKSAAEKQPGHPAVLAEMAQCYEQMGLADKAALLWRQIAGMNPAQSAGFGELAKRRLSAPVAAAETEMLAPAPAGPALLSLGACQAVRDPAAANGEKVVLRIPILRRGTASIDPSQVDIDVYFFDRVNGEKIAQTIADEPVSEWATAPVDWSGIGEESLNLTYFLPALTPGEVAAHGRRSYHGYVVRLYYQHKLQDAAAEPRDLLDFGSSTPQAVPGAANPLLPPVTN